MAKRRRQGAEGEERAEEGSGGSGSREWRKEITRI
jgi:hypothetical protein